jgi:hypothetical protein
MQLISVYLYPNKLDVFTNSLVDEWKTERYRQVYQRNLKLYRGVDNKIEIHVKTSDQKSQNVTGSYFVFSLVSRDTQELVFEKTLDPRSLTLGKLSLEILESEILDIEPGFYQYSIIKEIRNNIDSTEYTVSSRIPLYLDSQYETKGTIEVYGNLKGEPRPSVVIKEFSEDVPEVFTDARIFYSGIIDANPQTSTGNSIHTFQFYTTDYNGQLIIQGSLSEGGNPHEWIDLQTFDVIGDDLSYANITGKYNFFRVKHIPGRVSSIAEFVISQTILLDYQVSIRNPGVGYEIGDTITIIGAKLGGETVTNDLIVTVTDVNNGGGITDISWQGISYNGVKTFVLSDENAQSGKVDKILYR